MAAILMDTTLCHKSFGLQSPLLWKLYVNIERKTVGKSDEILMTIYSKPVELGYILKSIWNIAI